MIRIAILCLLLTGCGGMRQINVGAQVPIYVGTLEQVQAEWPDRSRIGLVAMYDREKKVIYITDTPDRAVFSGRLINEMGHLADDCGSHWGAAALVSGGKLKALCNDMSDEDQAKATAMREAWRAHDR